MTPAEERQPPKAVTRLEQVKAKLKELERYDPLDFWEEIQKLEREKASLEQTVEQQAA